MKYVRVRILNRSANGAECTIARRTRTANAADFCCAYGHKCETAGASLAGGESGANNSSEGHWAKSAQLSILVKFV
jgi:hypothetical protein